MLRTFPLYELSLATENARKNRTAEQIDRVAQSIAATGLKQNLVGYELAGQVFITAGGTRLLALKKLHEDGELEPNLHDNIPVMVEDQADALITSVTENTIREAMNPADRMRAYKAMIDQGKSHDEVCLAFKVTHRQLNNSLRIAAVPEPIIDYLSKDLMTLDHAGAYALGTPEEALEHFEAVKSRGFITKPGTHYSYNIVTSAEVQRAMTKELVKADNRLVKYVGKAAYKKAGGELVGDLFSDHDFFQRSLIEELALKKIQKEADKIGKEEGWSRAYGFLDWHVLNTTNTKRMQCTIENTLTDEEQAEFDDFAMLDQITDEQQERFEELEKKYECEFWSDEQKKHGTVFVFLNHDGGLDVRRGFVAPEDVEAATEAGLIRTAASNQPISQESDGWSAALTTDVAVHIRRAAYQCEMMARPSALFELLSEQLRAQGPVRHFDLGCFPRTKIEEALIEQGITAPPELVAAWQGKVPKGKGVPGRDAAIAAELAGRLENFSEMPKNIRQWWTPNEKFFNRLSKTAMLEVAEEIGGSKLYDWDKFKKGEMAQALSKIFDGTIDGPNADQKKVIDAAKTWLPKCLSKPGDDVDDLPDESEPEVEPTEEAA